MAALTAFLRMTPWVVPRWYAGSRAKAVPAEPVALTVAMLPYAPACTWRLTTPDEVYSHVSPGSSRLLPLSPLTYRGMKSSAGFIGVPLSSRSEVEVIVSADVPVLETRYVQTRAAPTVSGRGLLELLASSTAVGASGLAALTAFLRTMLAVAVDPR